MRKRLWTESTRKHELEVLNLHFVKMRRVEDWINRNAEFLGVKLNEPPPVDFAEAYKKLRRQA